MIFIVCRACFSLKHCTLVAFTCNHHGWFGNVLCTVYCLRFQLAFPHRIHLQMLWCCYTLVTHLHILVSIILVLILGFVKIQLKPPFCIESHSMNPPAHEQSFEQAPRPKLASTLACYHVPHFTRTILPLCKHRIKSQNKGHAKYVNCSQWVQLIKTSS